MKELFRRWLLRGATLNPPATDDTIEELEETLGARLPAVIKRMYQAHNGVEQGSPVQWRLLPVDEVLSEQVLFTELYDNFGIVPFFSDDNSNYAAVALQPPLTERVSVLSHDEYDVSPVWRSVDSFLQALLLATPTHEEDEETEPLVDYPDLNNKFTAEQVRADQEAAAHLLIRYKSLKNNNQADVDSQQMIDLAYCVMKLLPEQQSDVLIQFLDDDGYIAARACEILGSRKWANAVEKLGETACKVCLYNQRRAAIWALAEIGSDKCLMLLRKAAAELQPAFRKYYDAALAEALKSLKCQVRCDSEKRWTYKLPETNDWLPIGPGADQ